MAISDITKEIFAHKVPEDELIAFLTQHFSNSESREGIYSYGGCINVEYNNKHRIKKIKADKKHPLVYKCLEEFRNTFCADNAKYEIESIVAFSLFPLTGSYRYKDVFQIIPYPQEFPDVDLANGKHPFIIQFKYLSTPNVWINSLRKQKAIVETTLLLNTIIKLGIHTISNRFRKEWVIYTEADKHQNKYLQVGFFPDYSVFMKDEKGFFVVKAANPIQLTDYPNYPNTYDYCMTIGEKMSLPKDTEEILNIFFSLPAEQKDMYLRSSYWLQKSDEVSYISKSIAYSCLVQAIEVFTSKKEEDKTKEFKDFIESHVRGIPNSTKNKLYDIRSKIVHGNKILPSDINFSNFSSAEHDEFETFGTLRIIVTICVLQWLKNNKSN